MICNEARDGVLKNIKAVLCFLIIASFLIGFPLKNDAEVTVQNRQEDFRKRLLTDALERIRNVRKGLINWIQPLPLEILNYKPGGKAASIRQLVNHLAFFEMWMVERIRRAKAGEPDLSRKKAVEIFSDSGRFRASDFLFHDNFTEGDPTLDSEGLIKRLKTVRAESEKVLVTLKPEDLFRPIIHPADDYHSDILHLINHMVYHEFLHRGSILTIKGMLKKEK
jgi:uncharacterized damage-inducible protein DinB